MTIKVLIVRPAGNKIIEILAEGVNLEGENIEFTVLESTDPRERNVEMGLTYIDKKDFSIEKQPFRRKFYFLAKEFLKGNFSFKKAKLSATINEQHNRSQKYYRKLLSSYDIINIHYLQYDSIDILRLVPNGKKIIISLWGSDVFRSSDKVVLGQKQSLDLADVITLHGEEMKAYFLTKYGEKYKNKIEKVLFGNSYKTIRLLNEIKNEENYQFQALNKIDKDKIVIRIGYNGDPGQEHIKIINELEKLSSDYKQKIHLLIQLTYGGSAEYRNEVEQRARESEFRHTVFRNFLSPTEVLEVTKRTNIYLNLRTTDSLNNSMIESFLFDKVVICGAWLPYKILSESGVSFRTVDSLQEINSIIITLLNNVNLLSPENNLNSHKLEELVSNIYTGKQWARYYSQR